MIDIDKLIESGIITEYVLGSLSEEESEKIKKLADIYPQLAQEIEATWLSLSVFVDMGATEPPSYMEERIWKEVSLLNIAQTTPVTSKQNIFFRKSGYFYSLLTLLTLVTLVAVTWGINTNTNLKLSNEKIDSLVAVNSQLIDSLDSTINQLATINQNLKVTDSIYKLDNIKIIRLNPYTKNIRNATIFALWDQNEGDVYLDIKQLSQTPNNKKYQMWAISQIGRQLDLGLFDYDGSNGLVKLGKTKDCVKFMLTLEEENGSKIPTLLNQYAFARVY